MSTMNLSATFSDTEIIAFTIMSANMSESFLTNFVCIDVLAIFVRIALSFAVTVSDMS